MKAINKLTQNARTTEAGAVASGIIDESKKGNWSSDSHLTGIFTRLDSTTVNLTRVINRSNAESNLESKDEQRDNSVRAVYYVVTGFLHHPEAAIKAAAQKVDVVFEHYGLDIVNQSYATESTLINSMLQDFTGAEVQAAIAAIPGLSQMVENLKASQIAFETAQLLFQEEKSKLGNEDNATAIKKEIISIINDKLVVHLNAMVQIDEAKYGMLAGTVAQIIDDMNVTVKKRKKNPEQGKDADAKDTTPKSN